MLLAGLALGNEHGYSVRNLLFMENANAFDDRDTSFAVVASLEWPDDSDRLYDLVWRCDGSSDFEIGVSTNNAEPGTAASETALDLGPPSDTHPVIYGFDDHNAITDTWSKNTPADGAFAPRGELLRFTLAALTSDELTFGFIDPNAASNTTTLGERTSALVGLRPFLEKLSCIPERVLDMLDR
ncbi:MAG: hypothetical protein LC667_07275 [Thioalkalivibrio sp.]|nr:hypothetical protein [Thioalkalivibrio sp.]